MAEKCGHIVGTTAKRSGGRHWRASIYRRNSAGKKLDEWQCQHRHTEREPALQCARHRHGHIHGR